MEQLVNTTGKIKKIKIKKGIDFSETLLRRNSVLYNEYNQLNTNIEIQFKYEKILIDYNIIDFTYNDKDEIYDKFLQNLLTEIEKQANLVAKSEGTYSDLSTIKNYLIFFMIITINLRSRVKFIKNVFKGSLQFFNKLIEIIKNLPRNSRRILLSIINNLFLEEYKGIFFRDDNDTELENLFIEQQTAFTNLFADIYSFFENDTYSQMFEKLFEFNVSYKNFFNNHKKIIEGPEERKAYKLSVSQSIIRVVFSKEKEKYLFNKEEYKHYEYKFLSKIIEKDMIETRNIYKDEYGTLFRKEDICDDILKYMFFIFGNSMMIECMVKPINAKIDSFKESDKELTREDFIYICGAMINRLYFTIPIIIKILLKLVYIHAKKVFTMTDDNYSPIMTLLIFNFFINPRVQTLYNINSNKCNFIRTLNKLIRNVCYNKIIDGSDPLSYFNDIIVDYHAKLTEFIEKAIISFKEDDDYARDCLSDLFTEKYIIYPKFLFYYDSQLICSTFNGGVSKIITYDDISSNKNC